MSNPFRPVSPASNSFLPEDYIARKSETRVNILILSLFALVMGGVVGAFLVTNQRWHQLRDRQESVSDQYVQEGKKIEQLKALEAQRAQMMDKAEITAALVERVPRWAVLGEVTLRMPIDMRLDSLVIKSTRTDPPPPPPVNPAGTPLVKSLTDKFSGTGAPPPTPPRVLAPIFSYALTIVGSAEHNNDVADFLAALKSSPIMDKVELTYIREAKEKEHELRKFEVSALIRSDTDTGVLAESLRKLIEDRTALLEGRKNKDVTPTDTADAQSADKAGEQ